MNIYVGNISYKCSEEDLKDLFEQYGQVESVKIIFDRYTGKSKGFGFIEMPNEDEAKEAIGNLDGFEHQTRKLKVNEARPKPAGGGGGGGGFERRY